MNKYLIEYYPVSPNEWIHVYNINKHTEINSLYYEKYQMAKEWKNKKDGEIIAFNNSWLYAVEADNAKEATEKFWIKLIRCDGE